MSDIAPGTKVRRAPRWMWIVMVLSLSVNLVIVGLAAGAAMHWRGHHGGPGAGMQGFAATLPTERREALQVLLEEQGEYRELRRASRQARRRAREAFTAEPFDLEKLKQAYEDAASAHAALGRARGEWFTKLAATMTAGERRDYLEWRRRQRRGWRHHHKAGND